MGFEYSEAYKLMYLIRHAEEEIARRYHPADLMRCPTHLSIGQESASVGVMMALQPDDHVYGSATRRCTHRCSTAPIWPRAAT